ncbi:diaminopimelate epimerase [Thermoclostridium stercorarium]|uniref:Diaminopimelate epimerase n=1 Tax=Thermoclostridium stercorarium subsp. leptospartum DSM 9219 TaxID=1346611 RepID=A0A1B1YJG8_THEST|nr:diaminopimelate epimerase [Thermoclostridium stercorarium]ANX00894.1 diaminopimelate epimerase [Thermoclostridium stercorarium subsp. leptospartum DSM 9219]UZQ86502.1 diaminopimelate epimerase [Thermoclostridium stercorarium]
MKFAKMHGIGNDYVYVNCFEERVENPSELARFVSNRHFGVGSDGLVLILPSEKADFRMRMFNSDGSEAEMCGNAIRCVGKYVYDNRMTDKKTVTVETLAGIKVLELFTGKDGKVESVKVDMGEPMLNPRDIPVDSGKEKFINEPVKIGGEVYHVTCVSMGNPHAVTFVGNVKDFPLEKIGPQMENHSLFPNRINAEFVEVINRSYLRMRVWERGAGETMACGTGACAVLVAAYLNGIADRKATVELLGGNLTIEWDENNNHVYKTGPATHVFTGFLDI